MSEGQIGQLEGPSQAPRRTLKFWVICDDWRVPDWDWTDNWKWGGMRGGACSCSLRSRTTQMDGEGKETADNLSGSMPHMVVAEPLVASRIGSVFLAS